MYIFFSVCWDFYFSRFRSLLDLSYNSLGFFSLIDESTKNKEVLDFFIWFSSYCLIDPARDLTWWTVFLGVRFFAYYFWFVYNVSLSMVFFIGILRVFLICLLKEPRLSLNLNFSFSIDFSSFNLVVSLSGWFYFYPFCPKYGTSFWYTIPDAFKDRFCVDSIGFFAEKKLGSVYEE